METIKAADYQNREAIETYIINTYGKSTEPKDAIIEGSQKDLKKLHLHHGAIVWGVRVTAKDHVEKEVAERPQRGKIYKSKLNGQHAKINKSSSRKRRT